MDDQDMKNKKDLLDALDDPGSLSQEELDAILDDPKEQEDARLLGDYRQAFARRHVSLKPDVNKEWNNFRQSRISPLPLPRYFHWLSTGNRGKRNSSLYEGLFC